MAFFLILALVSALAITKGEGRSHGLNNESPIAFSPEAYALFHPTTLHPSANSPCSSSDCTSLPIAAATVQSTPAHERLAAATVQSTPAHESTSTRGRGLGAGSVVAILVGFLFVGITVMGVYLVVIRRRSNLRRANPERQVDA